MEAPKKRGRGRPKKIIETIPEIQAEEIHILDGLDNQFHGGTNIDATTIGVAEASGVAEEEEERVTMAPIPEDFAFAPPQISQEISPVPYFAVAPEVACPPTVFAPKPPPRDDRNERRELIDKIKKYRQGFDAARALPFNEEMSTDKLRSLLDDIRLCISSRNTSLIFRSGYLTAVKGVELVGSKTGLRCYGLADALGKRVEVADLLKEIEAEVGIKYISPWKRLAFITVSTAVVLDGMNRRAELLATYKAEPVSPVLDEKYKDL